MAGTASIAVPVAAVSTVVGVAVAGGVAESDAVVRATESVVTASRGPVSMGAVQAASSGLVWLCAQRSGTRAAEVTRTADGVSIISVIIIIIFGVPVTGTVVIVIIIVGAERDRGCGRVAPNQAVATAVAVAATVAAAAVATVVVVRSRRRRSPSRSRSVRRRRRRHCTNNVISVIVVAVLAVVGVVFPSVGAVVGVAVRSRGSRELRL